MTMAFIFSFVIPEDIFARRGGFGGGRSFRSSRMSSWKSSRSKSTWAKKSSKTMSKRGTSTSRSLSKADRTLYKKAKANGTVFKSRADAKRSFQKKYGQKYSSSYAKEPTKRPDHIPRTTSVDGRKHNVEYNQRHGGYGYWGPGGGWVAYSVMRDMVMLNMLMGHRHYYYGAAPGAYHGGYGGSLFSGFFVIIIIVILAVLLRPRL